jgi:ABC-type Mn2+/Zn2+ transport system permease subunit
MASWSHLAGPTKLLPRKTSRKPFTRIFFPELLMNMVWLLEPFRHEFMQRALFGCAVIGFTNGALSSFIVIRRLALMADAMAHSLLPGVAVALLLFGLMPGTLFVGALVAALLVAFGTQIISNSSRIKEDTSLGLLFACSFSLGLVLISLSSVRVNVSDYLFGNILGLGDADLWTIYLISLVALPTLVAMERPLLLTTFEPSIASSQGVPVNRVKYLLMGLLVLAMISSLQAVGVILALGMLIAPAATIYLLSDSLATMFWAGGILGSAGSCIGLLISFWLNLPSGPCIVLVLGGVFLLAYLFSPRYGIVPKLLRPRHLHEASLARWNRQDQI